MGTSWGWDEYLYRVLLEGLHNKVTSSEWPLGWVSPTSDGMMLLFPSIWMKLSAESLLKPPASFSVCAANMGMIGEEAFGKGLPR